MSQQERNRNESLLEIRYNARLHFLHLRLYRKLRGFLTLTSLLAGSAALTSVLQSIPHGALTCAFVVAIATYLDAVLGLSTKIESHRRSRERLLELFAEEHGKTMEELDAAARHIYKDNDDVVESLRVPAYNDALKTSGYEDGMRKESVGQRAIRLLA